MSFEDVEQIIKLHVFRKWDMWDQSKALEPWLSRIITNQIRNIIRNNYTNYVKPCMNCPYNLGDDFCALNISGSQDSSCAKYATWEKGKRHGFNIKLPLELENHTREAEEIPWNQVDFSQSISLLNQEMEKVLSENYFRAYKMIFFEQQSDEDVAKFLGYRSSEKNRKIGYKQIKNLKKLFRDKAIEILKNKDIL